MRGKREELAKGEDKMDNRRSGKGRQADEERKKGRRR